MATCSSCYNPKSQCSCSCNEAASQPVLPACQDVDLADGSFLNATVVVQGGCIVEVSAGKPLLYDPDPCCALAGGAGGSSMGAPGPAGPPGDNATVAIGSTDTGAPNTAARVTNVGSDTHAVLNFVIPQGAKGDPGTSPSGLTKDDAVLTVQDGQVKAVGVAWPPVMVIIRGNATTDGVDVTSEKQDDGTTGVSVNLDGYDAALRADYNDKIAQLQDQVDALAQRVAVVEQKIQYINVS